MGGGEEGVWFAASIIHAKRKHFLYSCKTCGDLQEQWCSLCSAQHAACSSPCCGEHRGNPTAGLRLWHAVPKCLTLQGGGVKVGKTVVVVGKHSP